MAAGDQRLLTTIPSSPCLALMGVIDGDGSFTRCSICELPHKHALIPQPRHTLCCDGSGCSRMYHAICLGLQHVPTGLWFGPCCPDRVPSKAALKAQSAARATAEATFASSSASTDEPSVGRSQKGALVMAQVHGFPAWPGVIVSDNATTRQTQVRIAGKRQLQFGLRRGGALQQWPCSLQV